MQVHLLERGLQQRAGLAVDPADRTFEGSGRLGQVGGLLVELVLAFAAGTELIERGEVDCAERGDPLLQPVDFGQ